MNKIISCEFNIDSGCVEICFSNGSMLAIDCTAVENGIETTVNGRSELDWLFRVGCLGCFAAFSHIIYNFNTTFFLTYYDILI